MYVDRKMTFFEKALCSFIIVIAGMYVINISAATIQAMNEAPAYHTQVVCDQP